MWRAAVVVLAFVLAPASAHAGVSRTRAATIAARALHVHSVSGGVRLEISARPLRASAHVDQAGPDARRPRATVLRNGTLVTHLTRRRIGRRAWLVWEDLAPTAQWAHPGVLALVDARSGRVFGRRRV